MNKVKLAALTIFVILLSANCLPAAHANDPMTKLGRGIANTLTGVVEIPKKVEEVSEEENFFTGMTTGLAKGVGAAIARMGAGLYDIFTFPFAVPENYDSPIDPEYAF